MFCVRYAGVVTYLPQNGRHRIVITDTVNVPRAFRTKIVRPALFQKRGQRAVCVTALVRIHVKFVPKLRALRRGGQKIREYSQRHRIAKYLRLRHGLLYHRTKLRRLRTHFLVLLPNCS